MRISVKLVGVMFAAIILVALVATVVKREDPTAPGAASPAGHTELPKSTDAIGIDPNSGPRAAPSATGLKIKREPVHPSLERFGVPMSAEAPAREVGGSVAADRAGSGESGSGVLLRDPVNLTGPSVLTGPAGETGPISGPFNIEDPGLPPEITDPTVSGPPPEADDPGIDYPAPEASDPGISYPAPEDSDPGITYPAPEDSAPNPTTLRPERNP